MEEILALLAKNNIDTKPFVTVLSPLNSGYLVNIKSLLSLLINLMDFREESNLDLVLTLLKTTHETTSRDDIYHRLYESIMYLSKKIGQEGFFIQDALAFFIKYPTFIHRGGIDNPALYFSFFFLLLFLEKNQVLLDQWPIEYNEYLLDRNILDNLALAWKALKSQGSLDKLSPSLLNKLFQFVSDYDFSHKIYNNKPPRQSRVWVMSQIINDFNICANKLESSQFNKLLDFLEMLSPRSAFLFFKIVSNNHYRWSSPFWDQLLEVCSEDFNSPFLMANALRFLNHDESAISELLTELAERRAELEKLLIDFGNSTSRFLIASVSQFLNHDESAISELLTELTERRANKEYELEKLLIDFGNSTSPSPSDLLLELYYNAVPVTGITINNPDALFNCKMQAVNLSQDYYYLRKPIRELWQLYLVLMAIVPTPATMDRMHPKFKLARLWDAFFLRVETEKGRGFLSRLLCSADSLMRVQGNEEKMLLAEVSASIAAQQEDSNSSKEEEESGLGMKK